MAHTYGYARVSTTAQNLNAQIDALTGPGGIDERDVVVEKASGTREDRPELARVLAGLREGDTLVVTKLDRLGRSAAHVARLVRDLDERAVTLRSLSETLDTSSAAGRLMVHVLAAVAQMEADLARERTLDGLAAARSRGRVGGRPTVMTRERIDAARVALAGGQSRAAVARALGISRDTLYRHLSVVQGPLMLDPDAILTPERLDAAGRLVEGTRHAANEGSGSAIQVGG